MCYNAQQQEAKRPHTAALSCLAAPKGKERCRCNDMEVITMVKQVKVSNFSEVRGIVSAATEYCDNEIGVHDAKGSIADAKSILGMMSLDYSRPVRIVCEDENALEHVMKALRQN